MPVPGVSFQQPDALGRSSRSSRTDGLLLDEDDKPLDKNVKGVKSEQHRIDEKR